MRACLEVDCEGPSAFWKKFKSELFRFADCGFAPEDFAGFDGVETLRYDPTMIARRLLGRESVKRMEDPMKVRGALVDQEKR